MVDKTLLLKTKASTFRAILQQHASKDMDAMRLLKWLTPLFDDIDQGAVVPPKRYEFGLALGKDNPFYEPSSPFFKAEAEFIAALEDWASQPWYRGL